MHSQQHDTAVCGTTIHWAETGAGEPLVLLHGILDSHRVWRRVAPFLEERFRLLMPDLPGHGYSGRPDAPYTLTWYADVVAKWMVAIGVEKAHVCGHSYGGGVAQWMVLEQRERIARLALVSAGGLGRGVAPGMRFATFPVLGRVLTPSVMRVALPAALRLSPGLFGYMEPEEQEAYLAMRRIPGSDLAFQRTIEGVINFFGQYMQTVDRAGEVQEMPPVAIFWGAKDPVIPVRHAKKAVARSEGITLTVYEGCGHSCHLDAPERFARDLSHFLLDPNRQPARFLPQRQKGWWKSVLGG
jgi:pimeloyl-ACP methyl ester carboxylesterase